ncbi:sensor histidine kinase [Tahibacter amnicola]|uniref:Sensor histidine kinase n=1 Tax=Tahibacter amnicola TaxID=2976241 RepID=A0ABY6BIB6_9GAMM|nr:sensor histidine kinase [Tahibacter amnicola]UXI69585.1 sensor histidine kinase [Tahibacter amnicola]
MPIAQINHIRLLRYAGLFTYLCVGIPWLSYGSLLAEMEQQQRSPAYLYAWLGCYLLFGVVFWVLTHRLGSGRFSRLKAFLLAVLVASAVSIGWFSQTGLVALLLVVVAVLLPWLLPLKVAMVWMVLQNYSLVPVFASFPGWTLGQAILQSSMYLGLSVLTFFTSVIAKQQAEARDEQRRLNSELRATRALLAESSRISERLRIARELHDLVGHHLTALSLNLEVASHLVQQPAQEHVRKAQSVAKLLLSDVREVVSQMRDDDSIDLTQALQTLIEGVPQLEIKLELPPRFSVEDPHRAHVLLRCAQEIITNTVRHAGARTLWLRFEHGNGEVVIHASDDGRGSDGLKQGNGLTGMRERLAQFGGRLDIRTAKDRGFALDAWLPLETTT